MPTSPDSPAEALLDATRRFTRASFSRSQALSSGELSRSDWYLMWLLQGWQDSRGARPSELARRLRVTAGNVTQQLRNLENQNLVVRTQDDDDRRVVLVRLTTLGKKRLKQVHSEFVDDFQRLTSHMGEKDSAQLIRLLTSAAEHLEKMGNFSC